MGTIIPSAAIIAETVSVPSDGGQSMIQTSYLRCSGVRIFCSVLGVIWSFGGLKCSNLFSRASLLSNASREHGLDNGGKWAAIIIAEPK